MCLDVINQTWSPMYDLSNIFDVFLPQLLTYPNPTDPLNGEAAALQMREPERYAAKVREYVQKYARPDQFPMGNNSSAQDPKENAAEDEDSEFDISDDDDGNTNAESAPINIRNGKARDDEVRGRLDL